MDNVVDIPEAPTEAAKFGVPSCIHAEDYIYSYHIDVQTDPDQDKVRALVTNYYFLDGDRSAQRLDSLVVQFHPDYGKRPLSLLEFASGYGCVSRHIAKMPDRYDLVACDIHPQAIDFLLNKLSVKAVVSRSKPSELTGLENFDVVFALSFFSHMPDRTFGDWISALFSTLREGGILIFTTHGRQAHIDSNYPLLQPEGYWFIASSEQKDLPVEEYGATIVTPNYVIERILRCAGAVLLQFQEGFWWGKQDLFVVRKVPAATLTNFTGVQPVAKPPVEPPQDETHTLKEHINLLTANLVRAEAAAEEHRNALEIIRRSTSWRITAPIRAVGRLRNTRK